MSDSPRPTRTRSRVNRKIFSCSVCEEVFVDEESLRRHELTHQENADAEAAALEEPAAEPEAAAQEAPPDAEGDVPAGRTARSRSLSSVRRGAAAAPAAAPQIEAPANFIEPDSALEMPIDPDATLKVPALTPLGWEGTERRGGGGGGGFGLGRLWNALEDFSEWVVRGGSNTASFVGGSVLSGVGLALRVLMVVGLGALCLYAGSWFGRKYGPRIWGSSGQTVVVPPSRSLSSPANAAKAVRDLTLRFYTAIDHKDYTRAYAYLSPDWQKVLAFDNFRAGYSGVESAHCSVDGVSPIKGNRYRVDIKLDVKEDGKAKNQAGYYVAVETPNGWRLDEGDVR